MPGRTGDSQPGQLVKSPGAANFVLDSEDVTADRTNDIMQALTRVPP